MGDDEIREYSGNGIVVTWEATRCRHAAEYVRGLPATLDTQRRPWIDAQASGIEQIAADGRTREGPPAR